MKIFFVLWFSLLISCSALRGQDKYTNTGLILIITEHVVYDFEIHGSGIRSGGGMTNYWTMPVKKMATLLNPLDKIVNIHIKCFASFPDSFDITVPAHTAQNIMFITSTKYMYETLCEISNYEIVEENK